MPESYIRSRESEPERGPDQSQEQEQEPHPEPMPELGRPWFFTRNAWAGTAVAETDASVGIPTTSSPTLSGQLRVSGVRAGFGIFLPLRMRFRLPAASLRIQPHSRGAGGGGSLLPFSTQGPHRRILLKASHEPLKGPKRLMQIFA